MKEINVVAYGGGTNSRAMIIDMYHKGIKIDYILFADPGGELPHTYEGNELFNQWLIEHGLPEIEVCKYKHSKDAYETLEEECLQQNKLPSIAYGGIKSCSLKWKLGPQEKFCKDQADIQDLWAEGGKVNRYIGYDAGEEARILNAKPYDRVNKHYTNIYYLYDNDIWRDDCEAIIVAEGIPLPGKSSCFFCPNSKTLEIIDLYLTYPEHFQRAVTMEHNADLTKIKGLGRTWSWETLVATWEEVLEHTFGGVLTDKTKAEAIEISKAIMQAWGSWEEIPDSWHRELNGDYNKDTFVAAIKKAKKLKRAQRKGSKADGGSQSSICDFLGDDEDRIACGCYD